MTMSSWLVAGGDSVGDIDIGDGNAGISNGGAGETHPLLLSVWVSEAS